MKRTAFWVITLQRLAADVLDPKPSEETQAWFGIGLASNVMLYLGGVPPCTTCCEVG